jgi:hypothetical protein
MSGELLRLIRVVSIDLLQMDERNDLWKKSWSWTYPNHSYAGDRLNPSNVNVMSSFGCCSRRSFKSDRTIGYVCLALVNVTLHRLRYKMSSSALHHFYSLTYDSVTQRQEKKTDSALMTEVFCHDSETSQQRCMTVASLFQLQRWDDHVSHGDCFSQPPQMTQKKI